MQSKAAVVVPENEWRAWARHQAALEKRAVALANARRTPPNASLVADVARSAPRPSLKPAGWIEERGRRLYAGPARLVLPSPPAERGGLWTQILALLESASAVGAGGDNRPHIVAAFYPTGDQQGSMARYGEEGGSPERAGAAQRSMATNGEPDGGQSMGSRGDSTGDPSTGRERSTDDGKSSGNGESSDNGRRSAGGTSSDNDQSVGGSARSDKGIAGDRRGRDGRGRTGGRSSRADRGDHGDRHGRGDHGDRGGRGDRDRGRD